LTRAKEKRLQKVDKKGKAKTSEREPGKKEGDSLSRRHNKRHEMTNAQELGEKKRRGSPSEVTHNSEKENAKNSERRGRSQISFHDKGDNT